MNSHQRRTVRRALDAMKPWGRAVARERRKEKRAKRPSAAKIPWDQDALIVKLKKTFYDAAGALLNPNGFRCRELIQTPNTSDNARVTGDCRFGVEMTSGDGARILSLAWRVGDREDLLMERVKVAGHSYRAIMLKKLPDRYVLRHEASE